MKRRETWRPVWVGHKASLRQVQNSWLSRQLGQGTTLYRRFNRFGPSRVLRIRHHRVIPPVVVELGELAGLIYRSDKGQRGRCGAYIHFMQDPPRLVTNVEGTQLYIIGGNYRVTRRGIEG